VRIWIDITNSPHVLFFEPLIADLRSAGHDVEVTARDYAQTLGLLRAKHMPHHLIGRHRGKSRIKKAWGLLSRSAALLAFGSRGRFDVAFSHNSNDLAVAAWLLRIPHLIVHDYEHADLSYAVNARLASKIMVPDAIPVAAITAHGARAGAVTTFPGLKEHVYLSPDMPLAEDSREVLGIDPSAILVVVRPPATMSAYHPFGNDLFTEVVARLGEDDSVRMVVLPRTPEQRAEIERTLPANALIPDAVIDGPSLIRAADLVVSAGGTMNREAAALGTPAYTVFVGEMGAVDEDLISRGALRKVERPEDVEVVRKLPSDGYWVANRAAIIEELLSLPRGRN
jgi:predicted glycosyltransferase